MTADIQPIRHSSEACSACGQMLMTKWDFCPKCGHKRGDSDAGGDDAPVEQPTADEPLRGLTHLGPLAVFGRERLLALAAESVEYVWDSIAVRGTIVLMAGPPSEGKTTLLFLILAARMTTGEPIHLLGKKVEPIPTGKWVVLIEAEHAEGSTSKKFLKSFAVLGVSDDAIGRVVIVARKAVRLGSPAWQDVERMIAAGIVSDVALDTVARVAPGDANNEADQARIFDSVAKAIEQAPNVADQPTFWVVAHTRKNNLTGDLSDVAGSVQRTGQADSVLLIKGEKVDGRTVSSKVTFAKIREDSDGYPLPATFTIGTDRYGEPEITTIVSKDDDNRPLETRILEQLSTGPKTKNKLREAIGRSAADVEDAISNLFDARAIRSTVLTVRGRDFKAFAKRDLTQCATPDFTPDSGGRE